MKETCNAVKQTGECTCPLCRTKLKPEEMADLGVSPTRHHIPSSFYSFIQHRHSMETIHDFKTTINEQLRGPTRTPLVKLKHKLEAYLGTDLLPLDIYDKAMEFELKDVRDLPLRKYQFVRMVSSIPFFRRNRKYFKYEFEVEDDNTVFATAVYEV
jgi:hypothetical protein